MSARMIYCEVCQRQVPFTETAAPLHDSEASLPDAPQTVCLGFGQRCAHARCPVSGLPSVVMGVQLARSGLPPLEPWPLLEAECVGCGRVTEMEIVDSNYAFCPSCGTTHRRVARA
jgi:hypothetical protein